MLSLSKTGTSGKLSFSRRWGSGPDASILIFSIYVFAVLLLWALSSNGGWARSDARNAHFPIINYFIASGFDLNYPRDLIAMFPGMHEVFAVAARLLGLSEMSFDSASALAVQSIFGFLLLSALFRIGRQTAHDLTSTAILAFPVLSSSYVLFSWIWPTTDLGSLAFYACILRVIIANPRPTVSTGLGNAVFTALSISWRQSNAVLGFAMLADLIARRFLSRTIRPSVLEYVWASMPIVVAAIGIALLYSIWGTLVPPGFQRHAAGGVNPVAGVHILAMMGLVGWPFVLPLLRPVDQHSNSAFAVSLLSIVFVLVVCFTLPLDYNEEAGRRASLVWTLQPTLSRFHLAGPYIGTLVFIGTFITGSIAVRCVRRRSIAPELIIFSLFALSLLFQKMSWQRYVEPQLLLTFGIYFSREKLRKFDAIIIVLFYVAYFIVAMAKALYG